MSTDGKSRVILVVMSKIIAMKSIPQLAQSFILCLEFPKEAFRLLRFRCIAITRRLVHICIAIGSIRCRKSYLVCRLKLRLRAPCQESFICRRILGSLIDKFSRESFQPCTMKRHLLLRYITEQATLKRHHWNRQQKTLRARTGTCRSRLLAQKKSNRVSWMVLIGWIATSVVLFGISFVIRPMQKRILHRDSMEQKPSLAKEKHIPDGS
mmetsp:Transcript_26979/g.59956  ORF Transcript_26979/g.59956 Transcript_26979/m.59956 type:complete len:210 (+) Transcript_26979:299-928(+)